MKRKSVIIAFSAIFALAITVLAAEISAGKRSAILLKANGEVVAQVTLLKGDTFKISGTNVFVNQDSGIVTTSSDSLTIGISRHGKILPITIQAPEVDLHTQ